MKILVAWDDAAETELIQLYLSLGGENQIEVCSDRDELVAHAVRNGFDVALMAQTLPTAEAGFNAFLALRSKAPDLPIVLGSRAEEIIGLPKYLKQGLRSYIIRDGRGDFFFLLLAAIESAVEAERAQRASQLAGKLREELDGVRKLQETIIPRGINCQKGYRAVARYEPSEMTVTGGQPVVMAGGDYYEVFPSDDSTLVALVGDASGHGLKACMSIITMHTLIRMISSERYTDTGAFVSDINKRLCESTIVQSGGGFITLFYGAIDTINHKMHWTSAGHPPALVHDRRKNKVYPVGGNNDGGLPLGITTDMGYDVMTVEIPPGARVLIFSDGLTDALSPTGRDPSIFGVDGICKTLLACGDLSLEDTMEALFRESQQFTEGEGRHDDTSVVLVERES
ncbi:MAG TPA: SpoIIE family protein phosphatase [Gemmataceae bacterium]|nr:SpoIIE family protein phosphatase [Gemmataceae bacterium]